MILLNLSLYDQTKVYVCFPRETLKEYPEEILIVAQLSPACCIVKITKGFYACDGAF